MKKYELTSESKTIDGKTLHRIRALRDFDDVKKGDLGGWVESEKNLAHTGDCWIYDDAMVYGQALVFEQALVCGQARVSGQAVIYGQALVCGQAQVSGRKQVCGQARVYGKLKGCCHD